MESPNVERQRQNQSENGDSAENPREVETIINGSEGHVLNGNDVGEGHTNKAAALESAKLVDGDEFSEIEIQAKKTEIPHPREEEGVAGGDVSETSSSSMSDKSGVDPNGSNKVDAEPPHSGLPRPEPPSGIGSNGPVSFRRSQSMSVDMPSIGKFIRERSNNFSAAIVKRLSSLKENNNADDSKTAANSGDVTEFSLSGLKVVVKLKSHVEHKGRISFFSRSNCRDCTAVRRFFREKGLKFIEINIDVYPQREQELIERTGSSTVPQIFFNEKLFGGLVALNSLRNSGGFDKRVKEMLRSKCPEDAPAPAVYGFEDIAEEWTDEMSGIMRVLRQRLPIQDRLVKLKIVKNCFSGSEMVEALIQQLDCGRKKVRSRFLIICLAVHHSPRGRPFLKRCT